MRGIDIYPLGIRKDIWVTSEVEEMEETLPMMKASDFAYTDNLYKVGDRALFSTALTILASGKGVYRLTVVNQNGIVKGLISALTLLDFIAGRRGEILRKREKPKLADFMKEPVSLFMEEHIHKLSFDTPIEGIVKYMFENDVGHVILVDDMNVLRGVLTERCLIDRLPSKRYGVSIEQVMTTKVYTTTPNDTIKSAIDLMSTNRIRRLPVLVNDQVVGIVSITDILRHLAEKECPAEALLREADLEEYVSQPISKIKLRDLVALYSGDDVGEAIQKVKSTRISGFPVLSLEGKLRGIISERDIVTKLQKIIGVETFIGFIKP